MLQNKDIIHLNIDGNQTRSCTLRFITSIKNYTFVALTEETSRQCHSSQWAIIASPYSTLKIIRHFARECNNCAFLLHRKADNTNAALIPHAIGLTKPQNAGSGLRYNKCTLIIFETAPGGADIKRKLYFTPKSHLRV